jgi:hypothetical protein
VAGNALKCLNYNQLKTLPVEKGINANSGAFNRSATSPEPKTDLKRPDLDGAM